jgi:hypothetical protein
VENIDVVTLIVNYLVFCFIAGARKEHASQVTDFCSRDVHGLEGKLCMTIYLCFCVPAIGY